MSLEITNLGVFLMESLIQFNAIIIIRNDERALDHIAENILLNKLSGLQHKSILSAT